MHLLTDEQLADRQSSDRNLTRDNVSRIPLRRDGRVAGGRKEGDSNIPEFLRPLIGGLSKAGNGRAVADAFGVSQARASQLANGHMGPSPGAVDSELKDRVDQVADSVRNDIIRSATKKLIAAMEAIKEDKLAENGPLVLSQVARNMASIVEKMEEKEKDDESKFQVFIYAPNEKPITEYPAIEIQAKEV